MYTIIKETRIEDYLLLTFDKPICEDFYALMIDGKRYEAIPAYGMDGIAIKSENSVVGKSVRTLTAKD